MITEKDLLLAIFAVITVYGACALFWMRRISGRVGRIGKPTVDANRYSTKETWKPDEP